MTALSRRTFASMATAFALSPATARAQTTLGVRIGTDPTVTYAEPYYAAVALGAVDIGIFTVVQLAQAIGRGIPFVVVVGGAMYSSKEPTTVLCIAKASPIRTAADCPTIPRRPRSSRSIRSSNSTRSAAWHGRL